MVFLTWNIIMTIKVWLLSEKIWSPEYEEMIPFVKVMWFRKPLRSELVEIISNVDMTDEYEFDRIKKVNQFIDDLLDKGSGVNEDVNDDSEYWYLKSYDDSVEFYQYNWIKKCL